MFRRRQERVRGPSGLTACGSLQLGPVVTYFSFARNRSSGPPYPCLESSPGSSSRLSDRRRRPSFRRRPDDPTPPRDRRPVRPRDDVRSLSLGSSSPPATPLLGFPFEPLDSRAGQ